MELSFSFGTIKTLLIFFGPILLPKAISYYRSIRASPQAEGRTIRPVPPNVSRALTILFIASLAFLIKTFPFFTTPDLFTLTKSRLQTPTDVLFTRLQTLRPDGFAPSDELLRSKFVSMDSRLLYLKWGPETMTGCLFCVPEDRSYLIYSLTSIAAPHLFNLCIIGLITSGLFTGKEGSLWRAKATTFAVVVALLDVYFVSAYDHKSNARSARLEEINFFYWNMQLYRNIALAALDGIIGWLMYLSSTNRAFVSPVSPAEKIEATTKIIEETRNRLNAVALMRNASVRDKDLRGKVEDYWVKEGDFMREILETREVVDGMKNALESRVNLVTVQKEADAFADAVFGDEVKAIA
ncbi:hypothetical protein EYC84_005807 [Monilinia fructicola]|uniref:Chorismate synthase protein n=1 Tax=Monilinia fructicola TaxID=38448 RepID=A0A5M9JXQ5_MONFR|nr:hypothetical protein EYC84_005807 [Monilinia fructicola]